MTEKESTESESANAEIAEIEKGSDSINKDLRQINLVESLLNKTFSSDIYVMDF